MHEIVSYITSHHITEREITNLQQMTRVVVIHVSCMYCQCSQTTALPLGTLKSRNTVPVTDAVTSIVPSLYNTHNRYDSMHIF